MLRNCFSKFTWAIPLKNKTRLKLVKQCKKTFKSQISNKLQTYTGLEFFSKHFEKLMKSIKQTIIIYLVQKVAIFERVNRMLYLITSIASV